MISQSAATGKHLHHAHHGPDHHHGGHKILALVALALVLAVFAAAAFVVQVKSDPAPAFGPDAFVAQMERAARGIPTSQSVFGAPIRVERKGPAVTVVAHDVPTAACVLVGWKLVRKGMLSINGVTPVRISAGKLSELCSQDEAGATLAWTPKLPD